MREASDRQAAIIAKLAERVTKPHPEFASPEYVQNLHRTIRFLADGWAAEIEDKARLLAMMAEGANG